MLDTDLVMSFVDTFHRVIITDKSSPGDAFIPDFLTALSKTGRFDMAVMFLTNKDKSKIKQLIDGLDCSCDKASLQKIYGI